MRLEVVNLPGHFLTVKGDKLVLGQTPSSGVMDGSADIMNWTARAMSLGFACSEDRDTKNVLNSKSVTPNP